MKKNYELSEARNGAGQHLKPRSANRALLDSRAKRQIPKSSTAHFVGEMVYNRGQDRQRLRYASLTEHNAALCCIYRPDFLDIEEQLAPLPFVAPNGKPSVHFFDFRVTFKGGRRICISVKPERVAQTYKYRSTIKCIAQAAIGNICEDVRTITERNIDPVELHNAKLFHSSRDPDPELDARVNAAIQTLTAPIRISNLLAEIGLYGTGFRSVARAIRFGQASPLKRQKITGQTEIIRREAS